MLKVESTLSQFAFCVTHDHYPMLLQMPISHFLKGCFTARICIILCSTDVTTTATLEYYIALVYLLLFDGLIVLKFIVYDLTWYHDEYYSLTVELTTHFTTNITILPVREAVPIPLQYSAQHIILCLNDVPMQLQIVACACGWVSGCHHTSHTLI